MPGAGQVEVGPHHLTHVVDPGGQGATNAQRIVDRGVSAGATGIVEETVKAAGVIVRPDDHPRGVDAARGRALGGEWILDGCVGAAAIKETVEDGGAEVLVLPDDLAGVVDAQCAGAAGGQGIVDGGVRDAAQQEAMRAGIGCVIPDDHPRVVDAECTGALGGEGIFDDGIGALA